MLMFGHHLSPLLAGKMFTLLTDHAPISMVSWSENGRATFLLCPCHAGI